MTTKKTVIETVHEQETIPAADLRELAIEIAGIAPYVQLKFSEKAKGIMRAKHEKGSVAKKGAAREARDFNADYSGALHVTEDGGYGIPAGAFRQGIISACRLVGFKMTLAKLSVMVIADKFDKDDGTPLVSIHGTPEMLVSHVRNATGVADLRVRAMWREWSARVTVQYDAGQFSQSDIINLFARVGLQVGVGEGRPDSKNSAGMGWGMFKITGASRP